jgi:SP family facilitated glucose transporter-like MFS transporter 1
VVAAGCLNILSKYIKSYESLMVGRFISGIFCGLFTGILPLYLNELPPQNLRGLVGTLNQFGIVLGILLTNMCGLPNALGSELRWPILVSLTLLFIIPHLLLIFGVESPKYLYITRNQPEEAKRVLMELRGPDHKDLVEHELAMLENEKINMASVKIISWSELFKKPSYRFPLLIAIGVMICQQFSGINAVCYFYLI